MKILSPGRLGQKSWSIEKRCTGKGNGDGGCGALLLVELDDIYKTYHHCYDGSTDTFFTFECAQCHVETDIDVPAGIEDKIVDKSKRKNKSKEK